MGQLFFTMVVPFTLAGVALYGAAKRVDVYSALVQGAGEGLETLVRIVPSLIGLMTAVYMLRASGALDLAAAALAPVLERLGLPGQLLPLMLVRPVSGSAALGVGAELIGAYGPDSYLGRTAAVMLGSTETISTQWRSTSARWALPAPVTRCPQPCAPIWRASWPRPGRCGCASACRRASRLKKRQRRDSGQKIPRPRLGRGI